MQRLPAIVVIAGLAAAGLAAVSPISAEDKERPFGEPAPRRSTEERPFGGPPPSMRGPVVVPTGKKCRTPAKVCALEKPQLVGAPCSCPGAAADAPAGKVEQ